MKPLLVVFLLLMFSACNKRTEEGRVSGLCGVWTLEKELFAGQEIQRYPTRGLTYCKIFTEDSVYLECKLMNTPTGMVLIPMAKGEFDLIERGNDDYLYFEDKHPRPLQVVNDSTIVIQSWGHEYTWIRNRSMTESRKREIQRIVEQDSLTNDDELMRYVLSTSERELRTTNHRLVFVVASLAVVLLLVVHYSTRMYKHKKRVELQLKLLREERELRPQLVAQALAQVEHEFLKSDFYVGLHQRVNEGVRMGELDWKEMERRLIAVYPNFVNRLPTLCRMSETEARVCLLLKYRFSPTEMAQVLCKDISTISSIRARLYQKVFNEKGRAKDWDDFILSL